MNLQDYYESLGRVTPPKTAFIKELAFECGVDSATVRTWVKQTRRPSNPEFIEKISKKTGIPADKLWSNEQPA